MAITRRLARPLLGSAFFVGSYQVLKNPTAVAERTRAVTDRVLPALTSRGIPVPSDPVVLARLNAGTQLVAATALALGRAPRLSAGVLAASLAPATLIGHPFWSENDPAARRTHLLQAAKNASIVGGLVIAAFDTEGRPGVAWRTRRIAKDARREARHLAKQARLEARLAAKSLT